MDIEHYTPYAAHCILSFCIQMAIHPLISIHTPTNQSPLNTDKHNLIPQGPGQAILSNTFSEKPWLLRDSLFGLI